MDKDALNKDIEKYWDNNLDQVKTDIAKLVEIPSSIEENEYTDEYPTGTGSAAAMKKALEIADEMGFKTTNHKNVMGIADLDGKTDHQIAFIGHCDVVPPGNGWKFNPYQLNERDGYLIGRGVIDDKGPTVVLLHAIKYWMDRGTEFPYGIRFLFGTDEETKSSDCEYYKEAYGEPELLVTPDSDFPVPYGEKGLVRFEMIVDNPDSEFVDFYAGNTDNAVSGKALAALKAKDHWLDVRGNKLAHALEISHNVHGYMTIIANGRAAHAAEPFLGIDAIAVLSQYLLETDLLNEKETEFFEFLTKVAGRPKGDGIALNRWDEDFGDLTIVPTKLRFKDGKISQIFDVRYPACTNSDEVSKVLTEQMPKCAKLKTYRGMPPLFIKKDSGFIKALQDAYFFATDEEPKLYTMGGATYARDFKYGNSFGPLRPWVPKPAWAGSLHGPNESVSTDELKICFKSYVHMINNLMQLDLTGPDFHKKTFEATS